MKLNYKRTVLVGFAFFLISAFWQAYDTIIPLILTNKFGMKQFYSGIIMALDNIFALFMLPLFGTLSDRTRTKYGRRTPYILFGTVSAVIAFTVLGYVNSLTVFIILLLLALVSMATFRSPAVALMPDVTVKPLRSKGNAIINLMGTAGGIIALILSKVFGTDAPGKSEFSIYIISVCAVMLLGLAVFLIFVREPLWVSDMEKQTTELGCDFEADERENEGGRLSRGQFVSLIFILLSVFFWFFGYNAVTSKYSVYASNYLEVSYSTTLLIAQAAAVISYIPVGMISGKLGRKKTILAGVVMLFAAFFGASFISKNSSATLMYPLFALAGIAWATINVNSFPMVVELAKGSDCGKYTGFYYTASMAAQILTPMISGLFMDFIGFRTLFPYAAVFSALSFITMLPVRHGDSKPRMKKSLLENLDNDL